MTERHLFHQSKKWSRQLDDRIHEPWGEKIGKMKHFRIFTSELDAE